ncbi:MAG: glycosyltransferase, partial [Betaproteobacteria bacterium]
EKDPFTFLRAAAALAQRTDIALAMIGGMRDPELADTFNELVVRAPNVQVLGALPHAATRQRIRRAHVLVVPSRMEGGANVVVEAVVSGTPVIAADCDGNVGMLGEDYPGYFPVGDHAALAPLLVRCRDEPAYLARLARMIEARAPLFSPQAERSSLAAVLERCNVD